jgi:hypothetical protein
VELVVSLLLLTVAALMGFGPFRNLSVSTQHAKTKSLANNLAQEQIEILKNKSYYSLLITTASFNDTRFSPAISYDTGNYPMESLTEGGIAYTRATRVDFAYQNGNSISLAPYTADDTGLKLITTYVLWRDEGNWKCLTLQNLMSSPATSQLNARIAGAVTRAGAGTPIAGAKVQTVEKPDYSGVTDNAGNYTFSVSAGSYTLTCSSTPYFPGFSASVLSVNSGATLSGQNFSLTAMASSPVTTDIYLQYSLTISQVVASTGPAGEYEYVEIYNPSASPVNMGVGAYGVGGYWMGTWFYYYDKNSAGHSSYTYFTYVSTYVPSKGYYLIANSPTVVVGGVTRTADAYYGSPANSNRNPPGGFGYDFLSPQHMFDIGEAGAIALWVKRDGVNWSWQDQVGWCKNVDSPPVYEGACIPSTTGLAAGDQLVRMSYPGTVTTVYGPAYDSGNNNLNFILNSPISINPRTSANTSPAVAGAPAWNGWVNLTDPLSQGGLCSTVFIGGLYPACRFTTYVATGTWSAITWLNSSGSSYYKQFDSVTVGGSTVSFPNAGTAPAWPATGFNNTLLDGTTSYAFVAGSVRNSVGTGLSGITVSGGGQSVVTATTGRYFLGLPAGSVTVTANPNNANSTYSSGVNGPFTGAAGTLYDPKDITISQAGSLWGYIKTSSNQALPNRVAVALQGVSQMGQASSDGSGNFFIRNLSTGNYVVQPVVDPAEAVSPSSATVSLASAGTSVFVGTFTVSNGLSPLTGQALYNGIPIKTGVIVMVTTATLAGTAAPALSGSSGCAPCYYETASDSAGNYLVYVRASNTPYNVYGWYTTFSGSTPTITRAGPYALSISTPSVTVTQNLSW